MADSHSASHSVPSASAMGHSQRVEEPVEGASIGSTLTAMRGEAASAEEVEMHWTTAQDERRSTSMLEAPRRRTRVDS